jgi:hypothetical protein
MSVKIFTPIDLTLQPDSLFRLRTRVLSDMMEDVENAIDKLQNDQQQFETEEKFCAVCRLRHLASGTLSYRCHKCHNDRFLPVLCDGEYRVCKFLRVLRMTNVWPLSMRIKNDAVTFSSKIEMMESALHHACEGGNRCPLFKVAESMKDNVAQKMTQPTGLDLAIFKADIQHSG